MSEDDDLLAAELAMGLLEGEDLRAARARAGTEAAFGAAVAAWRGRLGPLLDEVPPAEPPLAAWSAIAARLAPTVTDDGTVVALRRSARRWQMMSGGLTALAASLAAVLLLRPAPRLVAPPPSTPAPAMVANVVDPQRADLRLVATWSPATQELVLVATGPMPSPAGKVHELWEIPADGKPRSLGVMPGTRLIRMTVSPAAAALLARGATLAVSVEPNGGSPTGLPTGPVIAAGKLADA